VDALRQRGCSLLQGGRLPGGLVGLLEDLLLFRFQLLGHGADPSGLLHLVGRTRGILVLHALGLLLQLGGLRALIGGGPVGSLGVAPKLGRPCGHLLGPEVGLPVLGPGRHHLLTDFGGLSFQVRLLLVQRGGLRLSGFHVPPRVAGELPDLRRCGRLLLGWRRRLRRLVLVCHGGSPFPTSSTFYSRAAALSRDLQCIP
jgi:hypothetical protein